LRNTDYLVAAFALIGGALIILFSTVIDGVSFFLVACGFWLIYSGFKFEAQNRVGFFFESTVRVLWGGVLASMSAALIAFEVLSVSDALKVLLLCLLATAVGSVATERRIGQNTAPEPPHASSKIS
jgi:hypothetical protein